MISFRNGRISNFISNRPFELVGAAEVQEKELYTDVLPKLIPQIKDRAA